MDRADDQIEKSITNIDYLTSNLVFLAGLKKNQPDSMESILSTIRFL